MLTIDVLLIAGACVSFTLATIGVSSSVNLVALGLALWTLSLLI